MVDVHNIGEKALAEVADFEVSQPLEGTLSSSKKDLPL